MEKIVSSYHITAPTLWDGDILTTYIKGELRRIDYPTYFNSVSQKVSMAVIPMNEEFVKTGELTYRLFNVNNKVHVTTVKLLTAHQKIVMWCENYKERYGERYIIGKQDPQKTKGVPFSEQFIKAFFDSTEWWAKNKTIGTYCGRSNDIRMAVKTRSNDGLSFPMTFSKDFEKSLDSKTLMAYRKHLRENCGLVPKKDRLGNTIDWIPKTIGQ